MPLQNIGSQSRFTRETAMTKREDYKYTSCPMEKKWLLEVGDGVCIRECSSHFYSELLEVQVVLKEAEPVDPRVFIVL